MSSEINFERGKRLSKISTFGVGGKARFFTAITTVRDMQHLLAYLARHPMPYTVIGKGSNVLFDDRGFDGLVILNKIDSYEQRDRRIFVGAGYSFSRLGQQTARRGLQGLEFASGIPGSVGGAVYMNAGANGNETKDVLTAVSYVDAYGGLVVTSIDRSAFHYRSSPYQQLNVVIVSAMFELKKDPSAYASQRALIDYRLKTQPYGEKSAGCIFRNPKQRSAGALIEQAGLKGMRIGDAEVSQLHANFIVNKGNATSQDIVALAKQVQRKVEEKTGYRLELELQRVPHHDPSK